MRKWLRNTLICLVCAGVTTTAGYFIGVEVSENIRLSKANETFVEKLENANNFNIKHLNMNFFDEVTSHYFSFKLNNLDLQIVDDENCNLKTDIQIFYDYMEIYSGSAVFLDKIFYLETNESSIINENLTFTSTALFSLKDAINNTTFSDIHLFDFDFKLDIFSQHKDEISQVKNDDRETFLFEMPVKKYNTKLMFYSDKEFNLNKFKSSTPFELEDTLLSIDASNISYVEKIEIKKPENNFLTLESLINSSSNFLNCFNKENGKGISLNLGGSENNLPLLIYSNDVLLADLQGKLNVYNKNENDKFVLNYKGKLNLYIAELELPDSEIEITIQDEILYLKFGSLLKASVKMSTLEKVLQINQQEFSNKIKELLFDFIDLAGINKSFNEDYVFVKNIEENDGVINTTISIPVQESEQENTDLNTYIEMENNKFKSIYTSDISYENYTISNIFVTFNDELDEKPVIDPSEYTQYDTIIENLLNFN